MYPIESNAVDQTGIFKAEFKVIYSDGRTDTFPNDGYINIYIIDDLKEDE